MTVPVRSRPRFRAPVLRVSTWRAVVLFAIVGGVLAGLQGLAGFYAEEQIPVFALAIGGCIPWAAAGALYASFVNKGDRDVAELGTWARYGAKAGAVMMAASTLAGFFIAMPVMLGKLPFGWLLLLGPIAVLLFAAVGALQGALTGILVGNFAMVDDSDAS